MHTVSPSVTGITWK